MQRCPAVPTAPKRIVRRALHRPARGRRKRTHGSAVKRTVKRDELIAARGVPRQLQRRLHRFGAEVPEQHFAIRPAELFGHFHHVLVVEIRAGHVDRLSGPPLNGGHHLRLTVAGAGDRDSGTEIKKAVAIHIGDRCNPGRSGPPEDNRGCRKAKERVHRAQ